MQNLTIPQFINRYSYTLNNPIRYTDPSGHALPCEEGDICKHPKPAPCGTCAPVPDPDPDPDPDPVPDPCPSCEPFFDTSYYVVPYSHWSCDDVLGVYETNCSLTLSVSEARALRDSLKNKALWLTVGITAAFTVVGALVPGLSPWTLGIMAAAGVVIGTKAAEPYLDVANEIQYALENVPEGSTKIVITISKPNDRLADYAVNAAGSEPVYIPYDMLDIFGGFH